MHLKKRLWGISRKEISAISYCIQKIYALGFLWSTCRGQNISNTYQVNNQALINLNASAIPQYMPDKIYRVDLKFDVSKKTYAKLLVDFKKHAPRVHAKLVGKRAKPLERKKQNLQALLEKAERYLLPGAVFDEKTFTEFRQKMNYTDFSYHGTTFYCSSKPFYCTDINCFSAKKAKELFDLLAQQFNLTVEEQKVITLKKRDAWSRNAGNEKLHFHCTEGFKAVGIILYPEACNEIPGYTKSKKHEELYYTAITPLMIGLSKFKLIEIMQLYDSLGLKSYKKLWRNCKTELSCDKEYIRKRKQDMHQDLVERLYDVGSMLLDKKRYEDFFKLASITNRALDQGNRTARKILYDCMGMEPDIYCQSNHATLIKAENMQ